jgi:hypothetical protein
MTRTHRSLHRVVWPILALLVVLGVALALWLRPPPKHARLDMWHSASAPSPRVRGEGRGEGASPRVIASVVPRGDSAPLTPTLSPQGRGEGAPAHERGWERLA